MAFFPRRQLDNTVFVEVGAGDGLRLIADGGVVDAPAAALDQASRLAVGLRQPGLLEQLEGRDAGVQIGARNLNRRQARPLRAFLKGLARGFGGGTGGVLTVTKRRRPVGQHLLGLVDVFTLERLQTRDFVQRHLGEQLQELSHICVFGVAPVLPILIGR